MKFNPDIHHRQSIRLKSHDYSKAGSYFITVCTQGRECLFGKVKNSVIELNPAGKMIQEIWKGLPQFHSDFTMDEFVVMPYHIHGIIVLTEDVGAGLRAYPPPRATQQNQKIGQPRRVAPTITLPDVIHHFKSYTTARYRDQVENEGWPPFPGRLWQRNYYEHVIRNKNSLNKIREYIINNPMRWQFDRDNPVAHSDALEKDFWKSFGQDHK